MTSTHTPTGALTPAGSEGTMMRAILHTGYGTVAEDVLRCTTVSRPTPEDDSVLVRVRASSVDRGTWHIMAGLPYPIRLAGFGVRNPKHLNPGRCLAGTVTATGPDVSSFQVGDEVFGTCDGAFAEYVTARPDKLSPAPSGLSPEQAASMPVSGVTALQAVRDHGRVQAGDHVLVVGASGGVGTFAVQIAKAFGAQVTGVCSTAKTGLVRSLGADHVIDHTSTDFARGSTHYDVILDIGGNSSLTRLRRALTPTGTLVIVGGETDGRLLGGFDRTLRALLLSPFVRQDLRNFVASENGADLRVLGDLVEAGRLRPVIDRTYPLSEVADAVAHVIGGRARGKTVITI
ncbi:NAD(P)-dependent alcohol dehydrogenase [Fodinibacter luteus]|uniref:NAD(P)-dependent alcohol dehydrogenase n=1 Tax=Fodinibacter luteus TaxID=552064 RepID=A0ABP8KJ87_9MICO